MGLVLLVFAATYILITARHLRFLPIGRPAGALLGACAMVAIGEMSPPWGLHPAEAFGAVEPNTIGLLLGMMLLAAALDEGGFFEQLAAMVTRRRLSPRALLHVITLGSGLLAALLVNDSVCVMATPVVARIVRHMGLPRVPYLLALAMGANAGSALTVAGNPQNMLVAQLSGISYSEYLLKAGPAALLGLLATSGMLDLLLSSKLHATTSPSSPTDAAAIPATFTEPSRPGRDARMALLCLAGVSVAFIAGANLAWSALGAAAVVILLRRRDASPLFARVEWTVLVFFGALFVVVAGLQKTGLPEYYLREIGAHMPTTPALGLLSLSGVLAVASQIVSNVPIILLAEPWIRTLPDPHAAWLATALATTLAGNLTLLGSVANIIVIETAGAQSEIGFRGYAKVGVPVTLVSMAVALGWILLTHY
ncbi:SLC13 family permease [Chondromyces crocatus]|uniref:Citrate transporter n=1 Tax=Chondromyces crocatus TaxID=52 RepID=A0A0K1ES42_CHOCO|nr:SLC13 family permease [Chondromyces crocatus]AKT43676.1 citrate transporter [Chondromyces crocatus]